MSRRPYVRPVPRTWFMDHPAYRFYMLREASCVFDGLYALNLFYGLVQLASGADAWQSWLDFQANPLMVVFAVITFGMTLLHSLTFIDMAPRVMPQQVRKMIADSKVRFAMRGALVAVTVVIVAIAIINGVTGGAA